MAINQPTINVAINQPINKATINQPTINVTINQPTINVTINQPTINVTANQPTIEMTVYNQHHTDFYLCNDTLNIMVNFLPLTDICSIKLLNKYYENFIDTNFMLENYCHSSANQKIIQNNRDYLKRIIMCSNVNVSNDIFMECDKLLVLDLSSNRNLTDGGLKQFKGIGIHTLYLNNNKNITSDGMEHLTSDGMKHLTSIRTYKSTSVIIGSEAYKQFDRQRSLINLDILIDSIIVTDVGRNLMLAIHNHHINHDYVMQAILQFSDSDTQISLNK